MNKRPADRDELCISSIYELAEHELSLGRQEWRVMASHAAPRVDALMRYVVALKSAQWRVEMVQTVELIEIGRLTDCLLQRLPCRLVQGAQKHLQDLHAVAVKYDALEHRQMVDIALSAWVEGSAEECASELKCLLEVLQSQYTDLASERVLGQMVTVTIHRTTSRVTDIPMPPHIEDDTIGVAVDVGGHVFGVGESAFATLRLLGVVAALERQRAFEPGVLAAQLCSEAGAELLAVASLVNQHVRLRTPLVFDVLVLIDYIDNVSSPSIQSKDVDHATAQLACHALHALRVFCESDANLYSLAETSQQAALLSNGTGGLSRLRALLDLLLAVVARRRATLGIQEMQALPLRELLNELQPVRGWIEERRSGVPPSRVTLKLSDVQKVPHLDEVLRHQHLYTDIRFQSGKHRACTVTLSSALLVRVF
eukprot:1122551-Prymnesium_polylepis.1